MNAVYVIEVAGTPAEIGRQLGRYFKDSIRQSVSEGLRLADKGWPDAVSLAQKLLRRDFPELYAEVAATAETAGVSLAHYLLSLSEEYMGGQSRKGCTDIVAVGEATRAGEALVGHNNDTLVSTEAPVVLQYRPRGKPSFLAFSFATTISTAANEAGLVFVGNEVPCNDVRGGIPRVLLTRLSCETESLGEAKRLFNYSDRASSYNNIVVDSKGRVLGLEGSAERSAELVPEDGMLVHANHYLVLKGAADGKPDPKSLSRQSRAERLMAEFHGQHSVETFQRILSDHADPRLDDGNICRHGPEKETKFSTVFQPEKGLVWYAAGQPCIRPFVTLSYW